LPARPSFVPFVHEMTNWLAGGQTVDLNVQASWSPALSLPGGGGLKAEYRSLENRGEGFSRIDPAIDFNWEGLAPEKGFPTDQFGVTWMGSLIPPASGEYVFEVTVDDKFQLKLDGKIVYEGKEAVQGRSSKVELLAGKPVVFSASYEEEWGGAWVTLSWERPDGIKEVIPASVFIPVSKEESRVILGDSSAKDPKGGERNVAASLGRRGKLLEVDGSAIPGEYLVGIPDAVQDLMLGEKEVPLVVEREGDESRLEFWNDDDRSLIRREINLIEVRSIKDILAVLRGEGFGQEIWKILAIAALILFFLEGVLARWVSKSREAGEELKVDFEQRDEIPDSFLKSAAKTKGMKGGKA
ncbi:PA14 domain-containing protein, partial [Akkermansiaceae bacterium]|nr:PA14 domain-containing protein [Akkermansiaceae bacterium]